MAKGNPKPNMKGIEKTFADKPQPTPEQKKAGWERKRKLWYWIEEYQRMSYQKFSEMTLDVKSNPDKYNMYQMQAIQYVGKATKGNDRFIFDNLDRTEGKAIQKIEGDLKHNITQEPDLSKLSEKDLIQLQSILQNATKED